MMKLELEKQYIKEAELLQKVLLWLMPQQREKIKTLRINDSSHKGYSDILLCVNGRFVAIELKAINGTATPHQEIFIKEVRDAGGIGGVCRSIDDVSKLIAEARYENNRR